MSRPHEDAPLRLILAVGLVLAVLIGVATWALGGVSRGSAPTNAAMITVPPVASPRFDDPGAGICATLTAQLDRGERDGMWKLALDLIDRSQRPEVVAAARAVDGAYEAVLDGVGTQAGVDAGLLGLENACRTVYGGAP